MKFTIKVFRRCKLMRAKPVTEFKRRKRRPKVKFKVEDIKAIKRARQIALMPYTKIEK